MSDFQTLVHLNTEDFLRFLGERAAIRTLSLAFECPDDADSVLHAAKRLLDTKAELEKANQAWAENAI